MTSRRSCVQILFVVAVACIGCRNKSPQASQEIPTLQPATAPAGTYRVARDGVVLMLELRPEVRWSAHAMVRVRNESNGPVHVMRHAGSVLHDYQLKVHGMNGEEMPTRVMLKPGEPRQATRLVIEPGREHEEGMQLGMLFALRPGEKYELTIRVPVHYPEKAEPTLLEVRGAAFTVVAD